MPLLNIDWTKNADLLHSFLFEWSCEVAAALNAQIPRAERRFVATPACRSHRKIAEDVASFNFGPPPVYRDGVETGTTYPAFAPPEPTLHAPLRLADRYGANVTDHLEGPRVVGAVLFAGAEHKADSDGALALALRAAALMSAGTGVVIIDVLPGPASWATHLHSLTGVFPIARRPRGADTPIVAVHPQVSGGTERYAVWHYAVAPGRALPVVPVPLCGAMHLQLDLEATYTETCARGRYPE
jgi:hypothetical protein